MGLLVLVFARRGVRGLSAEGAPREQGRLLGAPRAGRTFQASPFLSERDEE